LTTRVPRRVFRCANSFLWFRLVTIEIKGLRRGRRGRSHALFLIEMMEGGGSQILRQRDGGVFPTANKG
jgi:hypothetical protein